MNPQNIKTGSQAWSYKTRLYSLLLVARWPPASASSCGDRLHSSASSLADGMNASPLIRYIIYSISIINYDLFLCIDMSIKVHLIIHIGVRVCDIK